MQSIIIQQNRSGGFIVLMFSFLIFKTSRFKAPCIDLPLHFLQYSINIALTLGVVF